MAIKDSTLEQRVRFYEELLTLLESQKNDYRHRSSTNTLRASVLITASGLLAGLLSGEFGIANGFKLVALALVVAAVILGIVALVPSNSLMNRLDDYEKEVCNFEVDKMLRHLLESELAVQKIDESTHNKKAKLTNLGLWLLASSISMIAFGFLYVNWLS